MSNPYEEHFIENLKEEALLLGLEDDADIDNYIVQKQLEEGTTNSESVSAFRLEKNINQVKMAKTSVAIPNPIGLTYQ